MVTLTERGDWLDTVTGPGVGVGGAQSSYRGAMGDRGSVPWMPSPLDPRLRYVPAHELARMRDRSRQLQRDNAIVAGLFKRMTENVVGQGFGLQVSTADPDWNAQAHELMEGWFPTADSSGLTWLEHLRLAYMSSRRDGDCATVLIGDGTLQLLEGDLIASQPGKMANTFDGVTIGPGNKPAAFTIRTVGLDGKWKWETVNAIDVIFFPRTTRSSQIRGEPILASSFGLFDHLDQWMEALLYAVRVAACTSLFIQREDARDFTQTVVDASGRPLGGPMPFNQPAGACAPPTGLPGCGPGVLPPPGSPGPFPPPGRRVPEMSLRPGGIIVGRPGDKVTQIDPGQPATNFPDTLRMLLRIAGASLGMPLELILLDFSTVSGPTARGSMLQAWRTFATEQKKFVDRYLTRVYRWRISKFVKAGAITYRPDMFNHRWIAPQWPMLDPVKEYQAKQMAMDIGEHTLDDMLRQQGRSVYPAIERRGAELEAMRAAGVPVYHSVAFQPEQPGSSGRPSPAAKLLTDDDEDDDDPAQQPGQ